MTNPDSMKIFIVIAAFNEEKKIALVLKDLKKKGYQNIVVVDDGSKDRTFEKASAEEVFVLRHKKNLGQGAALRTGINFSLKKGADIVVTFDADGQHRTSEIKKLVEPVARGEIDVALGSRFLGKNTKMRKRIRLLLYCGILLHYILYGVWLTDVHNGFRALSRKAAIKIKIREKRMEHASEIIEQIHKHRLSYKEIPVTIVYTKYSVAHGQTPWQRIKVGFNLAKKKIFGF